MVTVGEERVKRKRTMEIPSTGDRQGDFASRKKQGIALKSTS